MSKLREKLRSIPLLQAIKHPYTHIAAANEKKRCNVEMQCLSNKKPTIFSNDCIAGVLMKNYELPCNSPMVNCAMFPNDYVRYLKNIRHYMKCELVEIESELQFPVGELISDLGNIEIRFMHYSSFEEAKTLWKRRTRRIDLDNMNVILDLNPGMVADDQTINDFLDLPYNKVIITTDKYRDTPVSHYIDVKGKINIPGIMLKYKSLSGMRYYDDFDFIEWLNKNAEKY